MGYFTKTKDQIISYAGEKFLSSKIKRYGDMLDLNIDSENKRASIKVSLKGETEPLTIKVNSYEFSEENEKKFIILKDVVTSKEWMNLIIDDFFKDQKIELPSKFAGIIKTLL